MASRTCKGWSGGFSTDHPPTAGTLVGRFARLQGVIASLLRPHVPVGTRAFLWGLGPVPMATFVKESSTNVTLLDEIMLDLVNPSDPALVIGVDVLALGSATAPVWSDGGLKIIGDGQVVFPGLGIYGDPLTSIACRVKARQTGAVDGAYVQAGFAKGSRADSRTGGLGRAAGVWGRLHGDGDPAVPLSISGSLGGGTQVAAASAIYEEWLLGFSAAGIADDPIEGSIFYGAYRGAEPAGGGEWPSVDSLDLGWDQTDREVLVGAYTGGAGTLDAVITGLSVSQGGL